MLSKINAARIAGKSGASTVIASGRSEAVLIDIEAGNMPGTLFRSEKEAVIARKQWLASLKEQPGLSFLIRGCL